MSDGAETILRYGSSSETPIVQVLVNYQNVSFGADVLLVYFALLGLRIRVDKITCRE